MGSVPLDVADPSAVSEALYERVPQLPSTIAGVHSSLARFIGDIHSVVGDMALAVILNQAANEFAGVIYEVQLGRGREALKDARSVFELLVTTLDVLESEELAQRYLDHEIVTIYQGAELESGLDLLKGAERKSAAHQRRKTLRDSKAEYDRALAKYGATFRRAWTDEPLASRAKRHGLDNEYGYYRLASSVLHGAMGGVAGLVQSRGSLRIHRIGPAIALCPLALLKGVRWFRWIVREIGEPTAPQASVALDEDLSRLLRLWPDFRRACQEVDGLIWPANAPPTSTAMLAILPLTRLERWIFYSAATNECFLAIPPDAIPEDVEIGLNHIRKRIAAEAPMSPDWITIATPTVRVQLAQGVSSEPASKYFQQEPLSGWTGDPTPDAPTITRISDIPNENA